MHRLLLPLFLLGALAAGCGSSAASPPTTTTTTTKPATTTNAPAAAPASASAALVVPKITPSTDPAEVAKGEALFSAKGCMACHKLDGTKLVGPSLKGVTARREIEWIEKMILHPDVMLKDDPVARKLLAEHMTPMPAQGVDPQTELPALLAFLKAHEN